MARRPPGAGVAVRRLRALLLSLGKLRDGILVALACTYAIGYLVCAASATDSDMGAQVRFDAQYLAAGILPALVTLGALALGRRALFHRRQFRTGRWSLVLVAFFLLLLSVMMLLVISKVSHPALNAIRTMPYSAGWLLAAMCGAAVFILWVLPRIFSSGGLEHRPARVLLVAAYCGLLIFALVTIYSRVLLYNLPIALGGPGWRKAQVDLVTRELSKQTLLALVDGQGADSSGIVRSRPLLVSLARQDVIVVRVLADTLPRKWRISDLRGRSAKNKSLHLRAGAVAAIQWDE